MDSIKMDPKQLGGSDLGGGHLFAEKKKCRAVVNSVMEACVLSIVSIF
jgi:hypothetical protein